MMRKRRKLTQAISSGRQMVEYEKESNSPSRLARKLGVNQTERKRISLLQRTSTDGRAPFTRIADRVLGASKGKAKRIIEVDVEGEAEEVSISPWLSARFDVLRAVDDDIVENYDSKWLGHDSHGRPVWEDVLEQQRERLSWQVEQLDTEHVEPNELPPLVQPQITPGDWPPVLPQNENLTFRNLHICPQNERAALAINEILDHPAKSLNPLLVVGPAEVGKTHLLWATGTAFSRQDVQSVARILSCATIEDDFSLPKDWSERCNGTSVLLVDDIHLLYDKASAMHAVGVIVDWALNLGVQVILTSNHEEGGPENRMSAIIRQAVKVRMGEPSRSSLVTMLRSRSSGRNLLLDDSMLVAIVDRCGRGWGPSKAGLEELAIAVESGEELITSDDVVRILTGRSPTAKEEGLRPHEIGEWGEEVTAQVLDTVFADPLNPAVELHTELPQIGEDDYTPPDLMPESSMAAIEAMVERHIQDDFVISKENLDSGLTLHERDAHLVAAAPSIAVGEKVKVAEDLAPLSTRTDAAFQRLENNLNAQNDSLLNLESRLHEIALQINSADQKELIALVDELRAVESQLADIDPDSMPLPEFVEAKKIRRPFKRLSRPEKVQEKDKTSGRRKVARRRSVDDALEKLKVTSTPRRIPIRRKPSVAEEAPNPEELADALAILNPVPILEVIKPQVTELTPVNILVPVE